MRKPNLTEAMKKASGQTAISEAEDPEDSASLHNRPSRTGKRVIAGHFDPAAARQIKQLALDQDTSVQALLGEALNDLFTKNGKPPIA